MLLQESLLVTWVKLMDNKPTVCLDATSLVVDSSGEQGEAGDYAAAGL